MTARILCLNIVLAVIAILIVGTILAVAIEFARYVLDLLSSFLAGRGWL